MIVARSFWIAPAVVLVPTLLFAEAPELLLPKHVTPGIQRAVQSGLEYLAGSQGADGGWAHAADGASYPISMTALAGMSFLAGSNTQTRGPYADQVRAAQSYLMHFGQPDGRLADRRWLGRRRGTAGS